MIEIIFTRPDDDPDWERRIVSDHIPQPSNLIKINDDCGSGLIYRVDDTIMTVRPDFGIVQVECQLVDV